jgi:hypothetical protein
VTDPIVASIESAAAPSAINAIQALQTFVTNMGTDPAKWVINYLPAKLQLLATLTAQLPQLEVAEVTAVDTAINAALAGLVTKLKAKETAA